MSIITYSSKLDFDSVEDKIKVIEMLKAQRFVFNEASKAHFGAPRNSIVDLHAKFYRKFRDAHPEIPSQLVIRAEQETLSCYRASKSSKHFLKKVIEKKRLSIRLDCHTYSYKRGVLRITTLGKRVKCFFNRYKKLQDYLDKYRFCDPEIFVNNGDVWINIPLEIQSNFVLETSVCGIDLGKRMAAVTSEGNFYQDKKFNKEIRKLRHLKGSLKSRGTKSARKHLKKLRRRERCKNRHQSHLLSKTILLNSRSNVLALENLKGIKNKKHKGQNKNAISQVPFFQLKQFLTYKAPFYGKTVIQVDPRYTSKLDHRTGKQDGERRGRRYIGKDGVILDADHNASVNIALRSKLPASYPLILDGQAVVTRPTVCKSLA